MEHIFAKLVQDFEQGKITRRQLIQSLALAATAASAANAAPAQAISAARRSFKATGISHISYQVADWARTRDFYVDLLGPKVLPDDPAIVRPQTDRGRRANLLIGNTVLLVRNRPAGSNTSGIDHISFTLENWDKSAVEAELKRRGLNPRRDRVDGPTLHIDDPDGFDVQVSGGGGEG